jgi:hypothetical protein
MTSGREQREFTRVRTAIAVHVEAALGAVRGLTRDVSLAGVYVPSTRPLPVGSTCDVFLELAPGVRVQARGTIVRHARAGEAQGFAVIFSELYGEESYGHLRQLILYNSQDPGQTEREFESHLGLKKV